MVNALLTKYRDYLPLEPTDKIISLGEGQTPLLLLDNLTKALALDLTLYGKYEGMNPTGSFKDRGMTMAITKAHTAGKRAVICASTGNTSASAAAYAAKAQMQAFVLIPEGKIAYGKLAQAMAHGAVILQIQGNFDQGLVLVQALAAKLELALVNSVNPFRLAGQKTIAFEIVDELGRAPDYHYLPVGNAGNITAHWQGYQEYHQAGHCQLPVLVGYQAAGAAPFVAGHAIEQPETVATAIRIGAPASWQQALQAQQQSSGWFAALADEEILAAQRLLASQQGIFCEPASAVSLAGVIADARAGKIKPGSTVVCTLTGHGLKDPEIITQHDQKNLQSVALDENAIAKLITASIKS